MNWTVDTKILIASLHVTVNYSKAQNNTTIMIFYKTFI